MDNLNINELNYISPYVRRAWDGHMLPGWHLKERVIFDYEIVYIMEGKCLITIEDREYQGLPGELYIFRPGIRHSMKNNSNSILRQPHIHFDMNYQQDSEQVEICYRSHEKIKPEEYGYFREDINKPGRFIPPEKLTLKNRETLENLMFNLIREHEISDDYAFLRLKAGMTKLLAFILLEAYGSNQNNRLTDSYIHEKMNVVGEYIRVNYRSKITLDHLAKYASLSKSHLLRLFRNVYEVSPIHFQLEYKISKAKLMLSSSPNTISEISQYLCFTDLQHFSKVFKKFTGISPSSYRTQIRNKQDITTN